MRTTPPGLEPFASWDEVLQSARGNRLSLYYWGAMDHAPAMVFVVKLYKNGRIRVDPQSYTADAFTLDPGHLALLYRRITPHRR